MKAITIRNCLEKKITLTQECTEPSSWWTNEMIIPAQDDLPLDMRMYMKYEPYRERKYGHWHFFAPWHVFRLPCDNEYLIAQCERSHWLTFNIHDQLWKLSRDGQAYASSNSLPNIMNKL